MLDQSFHAASTNRAPIIEVRDLNLWYEDTHALRDVSFDIFEGEILAFIGPSGCGKSTALKCLNRMHDDTRGVRIEGTIHMHGQEIHDESVDPPIHRRKFGWVAQKPNPFPRSIWHNVAYGAEIHGIMRTQQDLEAHVESCLRRAHLWDEVKGNLHTVDGTALSGGQQQRLCIARALSTEPEVLLMDEPTGSIDPIATAKVEELMLTLKPDHSVVVVTHSMMEARRIADRVAVFHLGELIEIGPTEMVFTAPKHEKTRAFIGGQYG